MYVLAVDNGTHLPLAGLRCAPRSGHCGARCSPQRHAPLPAPRDALPNPESQLKWNRIVVNKPNATQSGATPYGITVAQLGVGATAPIDVFLAPASYAWSDAEIAAVQAFTASGKGVVLAGSMGSFSGGWATYPTNKLLSGFGLSLQSKLAAWSSGVFDPNGFGYVQTLKDRSNALEYSPGEAQLRDPSDRRGSRGPAAAGCVPWAGWLLGQAARRATFRSRRPMSTACPPAGLPPTPACALHAICIYHIICVCICICICTCIPDGASSFLVDYIKAVVNGSISAANTLAVTDTTIANIRKGAWAPAPALTTACCQCSMRPPELPLHACACHAYARPAEGPASVADAVSARNHLAICNSS